MAKFYSVHTAESTHSIDISKPEGISSFWNLCSKNDKKQPMQQGTNKPKINLNSLALKLLKLKGIDLTNIDNFEGGDFNSLTQNKNFVVLNSNQTKLNEKDLTKQKMFVKILNNQPNMPKEETDFELCMFPRNRISMNSGHTRLIKSSMMCSRSKKENFYDVMDKRGFQPANDYEAVKLLSSSLSESKMFMKFPEEKQKKRINKRLMVPVYIKKKRSNKFASFEEEYSVNNCNIQDETVDMTTLINKIKTMEKKLNYLETKTKKQIPSEALNRAKIVNYALTDSRPMKLNEENNYNKSVNVKPKKKNNQNEALIQFYPKDNQSNKKTTNKEIERIEEMLTDPNILIKDHNLVIPSTITEESLFRANPSAGCDTVLKLFDVLSEKSKHSNQSNDHYKIFSNQINRNSTNSREIEHACLSVSNNFCFIMDGENERSVQNTTKDTIKMNNVEANFPVSSMTDRSITTIEGLSGGKTNNLQNIFSLPIGLSTLKLCEQNLSDEGRSKISHDLAKEELIDSPNIIVNSPDLKTSCTKIQDQVRNKAIIPKLSTSELQINNEEMGVSFVNNTEIVVDDTVKDQEDKFERQEESERTLNKLEVGLEKIMSNHKLQNNSPPLIEKDEEVNSLDGTTNNIRKFNLNIFSNQCKTPGTPGLQKLLKKTTIACPVDSPERRISITILIEKNSKDEKSILRDTYDNKTPNIGTKNSSSSINLKNENLILKEEQIVPEIDICENKTLESCLIDDLFKTHLPVLNISTQHNNEENNVDKKQGMKQNNCVDFFGLSRKVKYLTKEQRQDMDKNELGICDRNVKSNGLPTSSSTQPKSRFIGLKNCSNKVNINSLAQIYNNAREGDKESTLSLKARNKYILNRSGRYNPKNSHTAQSFEEKEQSKTKIIELDKFYKRGCATENITYEKRPINNMTYSSLPVIKNEIKDDQGSHKNRTKRNYCAGCRKISHHFSKERKNKFEQNEKLCRFPLTLNEEALVRQAESTSPVVINRDVSPEIKRDFEKIGKDDCYKKTANKNSNFDGHKSVKEMKTFVENQWMRPPVNELVYRTLVSNTQTDSNKIGIHGYTSKPFEVSPINESNISECKQGNIKSTSNETKENTFKSELCSLQNEESGNTVQNQNVDVSAGKNKLQDDSVCNSNTLLTHFETNITNIVETSDNDLLKIDMKCDSDENYRNYVSQNMFNKRNSDSLESIEEEPESECKTKEDTSCWSCTHGCLIIPDDWNEEPEE